MYEAAATNTYSGPIIDDGAAQVVGARINAINRWAPAVSQNPDLTFELATSPLDDQMMLQAALDTEGVQQLDYWRQILDGESESYQRQLFASMPQPLRDALITEGYTPPSKPKGGPRVNLPKLPGFLGGFDLPEIGAPGGDGLVADVLNVLGGAAAAPLDAAGEILKGYEEVWDAAVGRPFRTIVRLQEMQQAEDNGTSDVIDNILMFPGLHILQNPGDVLTAYNSVTHRDRTFSMESQERALEMVGSDSTKFTLAMELASGKSFAEITERRGFDPNDPFFFQHVQETIAEADETVFEAQKELAYNRLDFGYQLLHRNLHIPTDVLNETVWGQVGNAATNFAFEAILDPTLIAGRAVTLVRGRHAVTPGLAASELAAQRELFRAVNGAGSSIDDVVTKFNLPKSAAVTDDAGRMFVSQQMQYLDEWQQSIAAAVGKGASGTNELLATSFGRANGNFLEGLLDFNHRLRLAGQETIDKDPNAFWRFLDEKGAQESLLTTGHTRQVKGNLILPRLTPYRRYQLHHQPNLRRIMDRPLYSFRDGRNAFLSKVDDDIKNLLDEQVNDDVVSAVEGTVHETVFREIQKQVEGVAEEIRGVDRPSGLGRGRLDELTMEHVPNATKSAISGRIRAGSTLERTRRTPGALWDTLSTHTPFEDFVHLDSTTEFVKMLRAHGKTVGRMSDDRIDAYIHMWNNASEGARIEVLDTFVGDMLLRSGALQTDTGLDMFNRFVVRAEEMYGDFNFATDPTQLSPLRAIPNTHELLLATRHTSLWRMLFGNPGSQVIEGFMSKVWAPAQLMRIGFIPRAAGEESMMAALRDPGGFFAVKFASPWASEGLDPSNINARIWKTRDYRRAQTLLGPRWADVEFLLQRGDATREIALMRPLLFMSHQTRVVAGASKPQIYRKALDNIFGTRTVSGGRIVETPGKFAYSLDEARDLLGDFDKLRGMVMTEADNVIADLNGVSRAIMRFDEAFWKMQNQAANWMHQAAVAGSLPTRESIGRHWMDQYRPGQLDEYVGAWRRLYSQPYMQRTYANVNGHLIDPMRAEGITDPFKVQLRSAQAPDAAGQVRLAKFPTSKSQWEWVSSDEVIRQEAMGRLFEQFRNSPFFDDITRIQANVVDPALGGKLATLYGGQMDVAARSVRRAVYGAPDRIKDQLRSFIDTKNQRFLDDAVEYLDEGLEVVQDADLYELRRILTSLDETTDEDLLAFLLASTDEKVDDLIFLPTDDPTQWMQAYAQLLQERLYPLVREPQHAEYLTRLLKVNQTQKGRRFDWPLQRGGARVTMPAVHGGDMATIRRIWTEGAIRQQFQVNLVDELVALGRPLGDDLRDTARAIMESMHPNAIGMDFNGFAAGVASMGDETAGFVPAFAFGTTDPDIANAVTEALYRTLDTIAPDSQSVLTGRGMQIARDVPDQYLLNPDLARRASDDVNAYTLNPVSYQHDWRPLPAESRVTVHPVTKADGTFYGHMTMEEHAQAVSEGLDLVLDPNVSKVSAVGYTEDVAVRDVVAMWVDEYLDNFTNRVSAAAETNSVPLRPLREQTERLRRGLWDQRDIVRTSATELRRKVYAPMEVTTQAGKWAWLKQSFYDGMVSPAIDHMVRSPMFVDMYVKKRRAASGIADLMINTGRRQGARAVLGDDFSAVRDHVLYAWDRDPLDIAYDMQDILGDPFDQLVRAAKTNNLAEANRALYLIRNGGARRREAFAANMQFADNFQPPFRVDNVDNLVTGEGVTVLDDIMQFEGTIPDTQVWMIGDRASGGTRGYAVLDVSGERPQLAAFNFAKANDATPTYLKDALAQRGISIDDLPKAGRSSLNTGRGWRRATKKMDRVTDDAVAEAQNAAVALVDESAASAQLIDKDGLHNLEEWMRNEAEAERYLNHAAIQGVAEEMPRWIDDNRTRSVFADWGGMVFPFWFAQEQFIKRFARSMAASPTMLRRGQLLMNFGRDAGFIQRDQYDNEIFIVPGSGLATEAIWRGTEALTGVAAKVPIFNDFIGEAEWAEMGRALAGRPLSMQTQYMLPGWNTDDLKIPIGPHIGLVMSAITERHPEYLIVGDRWVDERALDPRRGVIDTLLPTTLRTMYTAVQGSTDNEVFASAMVNSVLQLEAAGRGPGPNVSDEELEAWLEDVRAMTRANMVIGAAMSVGGAPTTVKPVELKANLRPEFIELMQAMGPQAAMAEMLERHPDDAEAILANSVFKTENLAGAPGSYTEEAFGWVNDNADLLTSMPQGAAWFIPQSGDPEEFNQRAWQQAIALELRRRKSPTEVARQVRFAEAAPEYFRYRDEYEAQRFALRQAEDEGRVSTEEARQIRAQMEIQYEGWRDSYLARYPVFASELQQSNSQYRRQRTIDQLRLLVNDPPDSPMTPVLLPYMRAFLTYVDQYEALGAAQLAGASSAQRQELKDQFYRWAYDYQRLNPQVQAFWNSVIRPELDGFTTELRVFGPEQALAMNT